MAIVGIMGALDEEIRLYLEDMPGAARQERAGFAFHSGMLDGVPVTVVKSGVGKVNAALCAQILIDRFGAGELIFTGVAGALDPALELGDIVISSECIHHDMDGVALGFRKGQIPFSELRAFAASEYLAKLAQSAADAAGLRARSGTILTGDQFIADPAQGRKLRQEMGGDCIDMESAAVAHACTLNKVPHVIIRSMSDKADHSAAQSFASVCQSAARNSCALVRAMLKQMRAGERMDGLLKSKIRTVPDWPRKGVMFRDITTLLKDREGFKQALDGLARRYRREKIDVVAGIESRGFIIGSALADRLGTGFVPIRKKGKLPAKTVSASYSLEYGTDTIEMHEDAVADGSRVLLVDDLIATGGTALAACELIGKLGGQIVECCFIVDLPNLGGKKKLEAANFRAFSLVEFEGE